MYEYLIERPKLFTDLGQRQFLSVRDHAIALIEMAGAASLGKMIEKQTGDTFLMLACVDRMTELGEIREVTSAESVRGQDRVFVSARMR